MHTVIWKDEETMNGGCLIELMRERLFTVYLSIFVLFELSECIL